MTSLKGFESMQRLMEVVWTCWQDVRAKGLITDQEFRTLAGGHWLRSKDEWLAPFKDDMKEVFEVICFSEHLTHDPRWAACMQGEGKGSQQQRAKALSECYVATVFGVMGGVIQAHLTKQSPADVARVLEAMKHTFQGLIVAEPFEVKLPFALIVLKKK